MRWVAGVMSSAEAMAREAAAAAEWKARAAVSVSSSYDESVSRPGTRSGAHVEQHIYGQEGMSAREVADAAVDRLEFDLRGM